jgi:hypothetical protein
MTYEEYEEKVASLVAEENIHPVLLGALRSQAYDRGHSSGYEECYGILRGLVYDFQKVNDALLNIRSGGM